MLNITSLFFSARIEHEHSHKPRHSILGLSHLILTRAWASQ